ncbi:MAG TPA: hypothetical protein VHJ56_03030, partial [Candidatus Binatia bacterium]|nr:hypothetical protein [Candidatus Binatia bacterium]
MAMPLLNRITGQIIRLGARALAAGQIKITAVGLEHIPADGPVLLIARHYHHLFDGVVLLLSVPRPIHILVTLDWVKNNYA